MLVTEGVFQNYFAAFAAFAAFVAKLSKKIWVFQNLCLKCRKFIEIATSQVLSKMPPISLETRPPVSPLTRTHEQCPATVIF